MSAPTPCPLCGADLAPGKMACDSHTTTVLPNNVEDIRGRKAKVGSTKNQLWRRPQRRRSGRPHRGRQQGRK